MRNTGFHELQAAQRVRQIAVDDARMRLVDADRACEAGQRALAALTSQAGEFQEYERGVLASNGAFNVATVCESRRFRAWLAREISAANSAQRRLEQERAAARVYVQMCLRANRAILRLIERRDAAKGLQEARTTQNELDDHGALRRVAQRSKQDTRGFSHGD